MAETSNRKLIFMAILLLAVGFFYANIGGTESGRSIYYNLPLTGSLQGRVSEDTRDYGEPVTGDCVGQEGQTRCTDGSVVTCIADENGAANWAVDEDCASQNAGCRQTNTWDVDGRMSSSAQCWSNRQPSLRSYDWTSN